MTGGPHISDILNDIRVSLAEDGTDIVMTWNEWPAGTLRDPVTQAWLGTPTPQSETRKAFVHYVNHGANTYVRFAEIKTGDVILDFVGDAEIDGREDLRFTIAGIEYVQKPISGELSEAWDALVQGHKLLRPVLLRKAT